MFSQCAAAITALVRHESRCIPLSRIKRNRIVSVSKQCHQIHTHSDVYGLRNGNVDGDSGGGRIEDVVDDDSDEMCTPARV